MTTSVGLVGYGRWGKHIFRDLRAIGVDVHVAVPGERSQAAAAADGAIGVHEAAENLPADLNGYVVAAPTVLHADMVGRLLSRGRPIFVEKPMTNDLDAARRLVEQGGDRVFVMDKWRYHPGVCELARQAKSGALGEILAIRTYRLGWGNPHDDVDAVWILLPHDLSIVLEILDGIPAPRAALAATPGEVGSDMLALLGGEGETKVMIEISANHPATRRAVVVIGTKAAAQLADSYDDRILIADRPAKTGAANVREIMVSDELPLLAELKAFVEHIRGGPPPRSSAQDGLLIVERVTALRRLAGLS